MYERILVPVDGSATSDLGLTEAIKLARLTGARLMLLHAVDIAGIAVTPEAAAVTPKLFDVMREAGEQILAKATTAARTAGIAAETTLVDTLTGRICDLVIDEAKKWRADLIVIGTHGRRGVGRFLLGSDAEQIMRLAPVPVLLVRAPATAQHAAA
ncbi:MAG TPA: universal stress protein [Burkholderiaceae bacterium]|nr:universal stress protein [Burkholderiaceae bacterium]